MQKKTDLGKPEIPAGPDATINHVQEGVNAVIYSIRYRGLEKAGKGKGTHWASVKGNGGYANSQDYLGLKGG